MINEEYYLRIVVLITSCLLISSSFASPQSETPTELTHTLEGFDWSACQQNSVACQNSYTGLSVGQVDDAELINGTRLFGSSSFASPQSETPSQPRYTLEDLYKLACPQASSACETKLIGQVEDAAPITRNSLLANTYFGSLQSESSIELEEAFEDLGRLACQQNPLACQNNSDWSSVAQAVDAQSMNFAGLLDSASFAASQPKTPEELADILKRLDILVCQKKPSECRSSSIPKGIGQGSEDEINSITVSGLFCILVPDPPSPPCRGDGGERKFLIAADK